jgi:hypothetical protein
VAELPRRHDPSEVGPPRSGRLSRGCPDAGQAGRCPVRLVRSAVGCPSNRSSGHPASTRPVSRRPVPSTCPDGHAPVSAALPPRCPDRAGPRSGSVRRAVPAGRSGSTCRRGRWAAWSPAGIGPDGKGMVRRWPWLLARGSTAAQGRRLAGVPATAPPWPQRADTGAGPGPGCRPGWRGAWDGAGAHRPPQGVLGRSPAWCPAIGLDQEVVTTLRGRWARVVPWRPAPEGPLGSVGGAACGRGAAAARKERCPLGADRALTSENSGGRDRV